MDYTKLIKKALTYMEANLTKRVELEDIAFVAGFSMFHFHRIFLAITNRTPMGYLRERRLSEASKKIIFSKEAILDIAKKYIFESQESFTRAFKKQFGITPGKLRKSKIAISYVYPLSLDNSFITTGETKMKPIFKFFPTTYVIGMQTVTTIKNNTIPQLWQNFMPRMGEIKNIAQANLALGVTPADPGIEDSFDENTPFKQIACLPVTKIEDVPDGMVAYTINEGNYAVFTHSGDVGKIGETYCAIYKWAADTGLEIECTRETFEYYNEDFKYGEADSKAYIYLPVK